MKTEEQLFAELRTDLDKFAASSLRLRRVEAGDYPLVDQAFYEKTALEIINLGLNPVGDFEPVTGHKSDGSMRCFLRAFGPDSTSCRNMKITHSVRFSIASFAWSFA